MPVKDIYRNSVRNALEKDNWQITKDPFIIQSGIKDLYIDLGAIKLYVSQRSTSTIT